MGCIFVNYEHKVNLCPGSMFCSSPWVGKENRESAISL